MKEYFSTRIIKDMPLGYALHKFVKDEKGKPCDYIFIDLNSQFEEYTGLSADNIIGKKVTEVLPSIVDDNFDWIGTYSQVAYCGKKIQLEQFSHSLNRWYKVYAYSPKEGYFISLVEDISDKKNLEKQVLETQQVIKRQEIIIDIYNQDVSDQQKFLDYTLHSALELTSSTYGYIYLYDESEKKFQLNTWTNGVMPDCNVIEKHTIRQLEKAGLWGEVVRQRKPIIVNNFQAPNLMKKGYPEGHVALLNYMSIPVFYEGKIVAVLGLGNKEADYTEFDINQLTLLLQSAWLIKESKQQTLLIQEERQRYYNIVNRIPVFICEFDKDCTLTYVNEGYCEYLGYKREDLIGKKFLDIIPDGEKESVKQRYLGLTPDKNVASSIHRVLKDKEMRWMEWQDVAIFDENGVTVNYYSIGIDINDKKKMEEQEKSELARLRSMIENHEAGMLFIEPETGRILDSNPAAVRFYGYSKDELLEMSIQDINTLEEDKIKELLLIALRKGQKYFTFSHRLKNGEIRIVDVYTSPIDFGQKKVLLSIIFDVTKREKAMIEIKHLAYHDYLTGIYNRRYFEETFLSLDTEEYRPLAIITGDINGLKMVNDHFGHAIGDELIKEMVKSVQSIIRDKDILARIDGDEFVILLTKSSEEDALELTNRLEDELERYVEIVNNGNAKVYLSVSFGCGIQKDDVQSLDKLMKESEAQLYRKKYYNARSTRSNMITAMMSTLFQKSEREKMHSERVGKYCQAIAKELNWDLKRINKIKVAGDLHDIGKIGINEAILNKEGKLNDEEWELMKQHPIKSAKILGETEQYKDIAYVVAAHHERWDGTGYPEGLEGDAIPIKARIIAVADAYDAMTETRPYRGSYSKEEAILELKKCAGTQFDPNIVDVFVNQVLVKD